MNEPGAFEPFVDNIESILKREIPTPIMYEHLKYNEMLPTQTRRYLEPWKMPTPILRNPYASQVKPHQKQHPVYTLYKPFYIKKNVAQLEQLRGHDCMKILKLLQEGYQILESRSLDILVSCVPWSKKHVYGGMIIRPIIVRNPSVDL